MIIPTLLSACPSTIDKLSYIGDRPPLNSVEFPTNQNGYRPVDFPNNDQTNAQSEFAPKNHNSLWQPGNRTFFRDERSRRVGDIVKIVINIQDKADMNNKTEQKRGTGENMAAPNLLGFDTKLKNFLPKATLDPTRLINLSGNANHTGEGKIARKENISMQIAATVTQILPNGNLVVRGTQEVRVNNEVREVFIEGIARPEDIGLDNSITSDQIAEARISYGGRGNISNVQQPRIGTQILDVLSPF